MQHIIRKTSQKSTEITLHSFEYHALQERTQGSICQVGTHNQRQAWVPMRKRTESQVTNELVHALLRDFQLALDHQRLDKAFFGEITMTITRRQQIEVTIRFRLDLLVECLGSLCEIGEVLFVQLLSVNLLAVT